MRTGAPAHHCGYFHEAAFYDSDDALLAVAVPFVEDGRAAGEPTLVMLGARAGALLRAELGDAGGIELAPGDGQYANPATTIADHRRRFRRLVAGGARQIRVIGEVPHPGMGVAWDGWARYEAVVNRAFAEFPLWGICPYDTRTTPDDVLQDVHRTHPHVATPDGRHDANPRFEEPEAFLHDHLERAPAPASGEAPAFDAVDPSIAESRHAAVAAGLASALPVDVRWRLEVAVSEVVTNAYIHGRPPVRLRLWAGDGRVRAVVSDGGGGPKDPAAGLVPVHGDRLAPGGRGLWIAHQMASELTLTARDGFAVDLVVAAP